MIDCHCHLEQPDYEADRSAVIERCKAKLTAVITCCAHPRDLELTLKLVEEHKGFVFATAGLHPIYASLSDVEIKKFIQHIEQNSQHLCGIGEVGLDFIESKASKERQAQIFKQFIELALNLNKPLVIHARKAFEAAMNLLEQAKAKHVLMHLFGAPQLLRKVLDNGWYVSIGPILAQSKSYKRIAQDTPLEHLMLETDSPWFGKGKRNEPIAVLQVAEQVASIKKLSIDEVITTTTQNAKRFFALP